MYLTPSPVALRKVIIGGAATRAVRVMNFRSFSQRRLLLTRRCPCSSGKASSRAHALGVGGDLRSNGALVAIIVMHM